jgi:hypothetical protein
MLTDVHGLRTIGLRIGNFTTREGFARLNDMRKKRALLANDAVQLVSRCIEDETLTCEVFNAISWTPGSPGVWLDTSRACELLGYQPSLRALTSQDSGHRVSQR